MKKSAALAALSLFFLLFVSACGNDSSNGTTASGGSASNPSSAPFDARNTVSETVLPNESCDPTGTTGVITGTVSDPFQGFVIWGVVVTLSREGAAPERTSTDQEGIYRFCDLAPGTYQVSADAIGFEANDNSTAENVVVTTGFTQTVDLELSLGSQEIPTNIGAVQGKVTDVSNSEGLPDVSVKALINVETNINTQNGQVQSSEITGDVVKETTSDVNGEFFLSLGIGLKTLVFEKEGFLTASKQVLIQDGEVSTLPNKSVQLFPE